MFIVEVWKRVRRLILALLGVKGVIFILNVIMAFVGVFANPGVVIPLLVAEALFIGPREFNKARQAAEGNLKEPEGKSDGES